MNYIGLDISINSTALTVYNDKYNFFNYTKKSKKYKWIKQTSDIIKYRYLDFVIDVNFSDNLIEKILFNDKYSDMIVNDINKFEGEKIIGIEGYNYGLKTTDSIIDISELSSIIKLKILKNVDNLKKVIIMPPKTVKIKSSNMVYGLNGKISRNKNGVAGGSFDKKDMLIAFIDSKFENKLKDFLVDNIETLFVMKNVPKPFDDIIDSLFIMNIVKNLK